MSEIAKIVDLLENRLEKIIVKLENLENYSNQLKKELSNAAIVIKSKSDEIEALTKQYDTLKITSSFLGSEDNKKDTKLKINSLIRDIDYCIAQLSD